MKALILTNGEYGDYSFCKNIEGYEVVICADNGMKHARKLGVVPDYILGDFDSSKKGDLEYYRALGCQIIKMPSEKDETDTELALDKAIELGACDVDVYGGLGSRIDHTLGNIHLLYKGFKKGVRITLINSNNEVVLINKRIEITGEIGQLVSLIPFAGDVTGVTTKGLAYALDRGVLPMGKPIGVSNYMKERLVSVTIESGLLLVIKSRD